VTIVVDFNIKLKLRYFSIHDNEMHEI